MDIVLKGKKPELDFPYFGRQARFYEFFEACISPLMSEGGIYAETNSGSNSNGYKFAKKGYKVILNDLSVYSNSIAKAVFTNDIPKAKSNDKWYDEYTETYEKRAALLAGLIDTYGYNPVVPKKLNDELKNNINKYLEHIKCIKKDKVQAYKIYNLDLFKYLDKLKKENIKVDVMFMDFAWPWRDGTMTDEYDTTANIFADVVGEKNEKVKIWDKTNVIHEVLKAIKKARKVSKYVLLSNQSSNYPTPEILEVALLKNNINYTIRHTMLTEEEYEDDLGKSDFFREYLYVIEGEMIE